MKEIQHKTKRTLMDQEVPNMVELQLESYKWFLNEGLRELFRSFSPINDYADNFSLELVDYKLDRPKYTEAECRYRDMTTYEAPIKAIVNLIRKENGQIVSVIPEEVYMGELPLMTDKGTFVINGAERVVVSQLSRSPGAYFEDNIDLSGKLLYIGRIIPSSGAWIEVETDSHNVMNAHLAQSAKFPFTLLLRALNMLDEASPVLIDSLVGNVISCDISDVETGEILVDSGSEITPGIAKKLKKIFTSGFVCNRHLGTKTSTTIDLLEVFGKKNTIKITKRYYLRSGQVVNVPAVDKDQKINKLIRVFDIDIIDESQTVLFKNGSEIDEYSIAFLDKNKEKDKQKKEYSIEDKRPVNDVLNEKGEVICKAGELITKETATEIYELGNAYLEIYTLDPFVNDTLKNENPKSDIKSDTKPIVVTDAYSALLALHKFLRPKDPVTEKSAFELIRGYLFDNKRYDIGKVGRYKLNKKLGLNKPEFAKIGDHYTRSITRDDILKLIQYIICLNSDGKIISHFDKKRRDIKISLIEEFIANEEKSATPLELLPDGKISNYKRLFNEFKSCEKGKLFTGEEYEEFISFLRLIPDVLKIVSDSPENLEHSTNAMRFASCTTDEIDHLENKRVRSVGELLQDQLRNGFLRMEKVAKERMTHNDIDKIMPQLLLSVKPISASIRSFFGSSQLSQFMDQTNPLAELTHKRRLSALGPGGLSRQSAKLEVRDVHHSHYGRICPIETPEGPNIGLIGSMAIHARIDEYGFLRTPYRVVKSGKVADDIKYLSADEESHEYIATANTKYDVENGEFVDENITVRHDGKYPRVSNKKVTLMEISPNQIMSVAANLIPFIENDDANRALMGSNMQRQAVPLLRPSAPIVRTGVERRTAHDSGVEILAKREGKIIWTSCDFIIILPEEKKYVDRYIFKPLVNEGSFVLAGQPICELTVARYEYGGDSNYTFDVETTPVDIEVIRPGCVSIMTVGGARTIAVNPNKASLVTFEEDISCDLKAGDIICKGKIYSGENHEDTYKVVNAFDGIVDKINSDGSVIIDEFDFYSIEPVVLRNSFPSKYAICKINDYFVVARSAGCGMVKEQVIIHKNELVSAFDIIVCDEYRLHNMVRSNQGTCINSRPVVRLGQRVRFDDLLADGPCTDQGELALGQNVLVAFMPWNGYNYEDAILLNQRLVKDDKFSSVHIEKFETEARDTKLGPEEITRDIPNVSEDSLKDLDQNGVIRIGAEVRAEDILVGKVAPKGQSELTAEERLIIAIFGKKAEETRDVSLKVPHGESGTIVDVKIFSRYKYHCSNPDCEKNYDFCKKPEKTALKCERCDSKLEKDEADELNAGVNQLIRVYIAQKRKIMQGDKMAGRHGNKGVISNILPECEMPFLPDGTPVDIVLNPLGVPSRMNIGQILETHQGLAGDYLGVKFKNPIFQSSKEAEIIADLVLMTELKKVKTLKYYLKELKLFVDIKDRDVSMATSNAIKNLEEIAFIHEILDEAAKPITDLYKGYTNEVKALLETYSAFELELLSQKIGGIPVLSEEDSLKISEYTNIMIEIEKINRIMETSSISEDEIENEEVEHIKIPELQMKAEIIANELKSVSKSVDYDYDSLIKLIDDIVIKRVGFHAKLAKTDLYDGRTGQKLNQPVAVGMIYMLKLAHLVEDKIHARATGPYSLVTQQPLGGKAQFGGQRFGEMEVWALEAYGAAYTLQEILTIKSDDVTGRVKTYESIVKGKTIMEPGIPESFKILINELQSLCLKVTVEDEDGKSIDLKSTDDYETRDPYGAEIAFGK